MRERITKNDERPGFTGQATPARLRRSATPRRERYAQARAFRRGERTKAVRVAAFTLIELLVVMLVIVILSGITISVSKYASWRARKARAEAEFHKIKAGLEEYRAVYGEYPILGDPNHYPVFLLTDVATATNLPPDYRQVNLVNTNAKGQIGVEYLPLVSAKYVDYRLTYPLKIKPESEGRAAFVDFPLITLCYVIYRDTTKEIQQVDSLGRTRWLLKGDPVNRIMAIDPETGYQWKYDCTNGMSYTLTNAPYFVSGSYVNQ